jgi:hypothetical protein
MSDFKPMSEFDPSKLVMVRMADTGDTIPWDPEWMARFKETAKERSPGVLEFDGALLDGWIECEEAVQDTCV